MSLSKSIVVSPAPVAVVITPYAMAKMSEDFHLASLQYLPNRPPLINYYLYCASIELALKSAMLNVDCTEGRKTKLKKDIGHDLEKLTSSHEAIVEKKLLNNVEKQTLQTINKYYRTKGLEYFTVVMAEAMLRGYKDLPDINNLKQISGKLQEHLKSKDYFIGATTSDTPTTGIFTIY